MAKKNPKSVVQEILKSEGKTYKDWIREKHNEFIQESVLSGKLLFATEDQVKKKAEKMAEIKVQKIIDDESNIEKTLAEEEKY